MASTHEVHYLPDGMPLPVASADGLDGAFWEATKGHRLVIQRCVDCRTWQFGPEWICHHCLGADLTWEEVAPRGQIFSWERCWHPVHPALNDAGPYLVVLVELPDAGHVRLVGNLLGDPLQEIVIGTGVEAVFEDHGDAATLVQWRVVEAEVRDVQDEPRRGVES